MTIPKKSTCLKFKNIDSLPNDKFLDLTKFKAFAEDKLDMANMVMSVFDKVENIVGKGEYAGYQHFLLFSTMISKGPFLRVSIVW